MSKVASEHPPATRPFPMITVRSRRDIEEEISRRVEAERVRLQQQSRPIVNQTAHFRRPEERPFTAAERDKVTILFGGLSWKHEWLIKSVFESAGLKIEALPTPDVAAFQLGKEYGNNGQCNPTYFTVGHLIKYLQGLERKGLSRQEIVDQYVFVTAGSCGPCRFGMYEAEYRLAVQNAGFDGFRIVIIQQNQGINADTPAPALDFTPDFRLGTIQAINAGDVLNDVANQIRPFEVVAGQTDRMLQEAMTALSDALRNRPRMKSADRLPAWAARQLERRPGLNTLLDTLAALYGQSYGRYSMQALHDVRDRLNTIEVDRLRVKPVVKITGEFWAQTTEGDGNFHMFAFLEREGAQVIVEPVANWIMYLMWVAKARFLQDVRTATPPLWQVHRRAGHTLKLRKGVLLFDLGRYVYNRQYDRLVQALGGTAHHLTDMDELARLAAPYYNTMARGGEGHLEVGKNIYYTVRKKCHMVLSLKPFGCMPSSQSDGVQSAVMSHFKDMIFLPIETSGEGEINAHSRVQMALGEAKMKAKQEFQGTLESIGRNLDEIRAFVDEHPGLRRPFYPVPHRPGIAGTAAQFVLHVHDLMAGRARPATVPGVA
jgi:predicted nucleotide-binding protein (sugar kinase/HSP70/actin superfamily)